MKEEPFAAASGSQVRFGAEDARAAAQLQDSEKPPPMCAESLPQTDPPGTTLFTHDECWKASPGSAGVGAVNAPAHHRNGGGLDLSAACAEAPAGKHVTFGGVVRKCY